jgi:cytochrome c
MKRTVFRRAPAALALATCLHGLVTPSAAHAGDAKAGSDVFKTECSECHSLQAGRNKKGPSLFGVVGRKAASVPDYHYSDALLAKTDWVWTAEQLQTYLSQPAKRVNPGTKMKYDGLDNSQQLGDLIAYLETLR